MLACPHCEQPVFTLTGDRLKARVSILVLHKSGAVEVNCRHCKRGIILPLAMEPILALKKADTPRLVVPMAKGLTSR